MGKWKKMKLTGEMVNSFNVPVERVQSDQLEVDDDELENLEASD